MPPKTTDRKNKKGTGPSAEKSKSAKLLEKLRKVNPDTPTPKVAKKIVQDEFSQIVQNVSEQMDYTHHKGTSTEDLETLCRLAFPREFKGVFASDQKLPTEGYFIVNTDPSQLPGTHWTAFADGVFYDSFDRTLRQVFPMVTFRGKRYNPTSSNNSDVRQKIRESNCGERCVAFLAIVNKYGADVAQRFL